MAERNPFLNQSASWRGSLSNYVNIDGGKTQTGEIEVAVEIINDILTIKNRLFRPDGSQTDYEGALEARIVGNRLLNIHEQTVDPNTKNQIRNHQFEGYFTQNHIFIVETYTEVFKDQEKEEMRHNELHYYLPDVDTALNVISVHVKDKLLVFGNAYLKRQ
ncbi:MAG: hypothetical protein FH749_08775 [Firmicutes bacterium]|nr:hypothetical protein [Bacillota bacterium]